LSCFQVTCNPEKHAGTIREYFCNAEAGSDPYLEILHRGDVIAKHFHTLISNVPGLLV